MLPIVARKPYGIKLYSVMSVDVQAPNLPTRWYNDMHTRYKVQVSLSRLGLGQLKQTEMCSYPFCVRPFVCHGCSAIYCLHGVFQLELGRYRYSVYRLSTIVSMHTKHWCFRFFFHFLLCAVKVVIWFFYCPNKWNNTSSLFPVGRYRIFCANVLIEWRSHNNRSCFASIASFAAVKLQTTQCWLHRKWQRCSSFRNSNYYGRWNCGE